MILSGRLTSVYSELLNTAFSPIEVTCWCYPHNHDWYRHSADKPKKYRPMPDSGSTFRLFRITADAWDVYECNQKWSNGNSESRFNNKLCDPRVTDPRSHAPSKHREWDPSKGWCTTELEISRNFEGCCQSLRVFKLKMSTGCWKRFPFTHICNSWIRHWRPCKTHSYWTKSACFQLKLVDGMSWIG